MIYMYGITRMDLRNTAGFEMFYIQRYVKKLIEINYLYRYNFKGFLIT